jgi:hypothetical protein
MFVCTAFAKVSVNGRQVTVTPTDEVGRTYDVETYDVQTYTFPSSGGDAAPLVHTRRSGDL